MNMSTVFESLAGEPSLWSSGTRALVTLVVAILSVSILMINRSLKRKRYNLPPGPRTYPAIGNLLDMRRGENGADLAEIWWRLAQKNKWPVMSFRFPCRRLIVLLNSSETTKEMLVTKGHLFISRDNDTYGNLGLRMSPDGKTECGALFTPHGPAWRMTRKLMVAGQNEFKKVGGDDYIIKVLLPQLYREIDRDVCIQARIRIAKMMVTRILMVFVFGPGAEIYADMIVPLNDDLFRVIDRNNAIELFLPFFGRQASWLHYSLIQKRLIARKHKAYEFILSERGIKYNQDKQWSLSDMVQAAEKNGEITHHQGLQIYEECFFAGQDTTGAPIEGLLKILVETPRVLLKVQQEMDDVLGTAKHFRLGDVDRLPYFQAVIKEGLRLHRAIPLLIPHVCYEDNTLGGYDIPKGTLVAVNLWGLARDPTIFPDPYEVKPERFLDMNTNFSGTDCKYVTFGVGQRLCPGQSVALLMVNILIASLCHRYNFALGNDWKHEKDEGPGTFFVERALYLNLTKRDCAPDICNL